MNLREFVPMLICSLLVMGRGAVAQVPELINYQGRLASDGELVNGSATIGFRIYDCEHDGIPLYAETQRVTIVDGLYSAQIGASNAVPGALSQALSSRPAYLEIAVDGDTLTPRERLTAVAYARVAASVEDGAITSASLAPGTLSGVSVKALVEDFVVAYTDVANGSYGKAITGNAEGTTLSWGTPSVFNAAYTRHMCVAALNAGSCTVVYRDDGNSYFGTARSGTLSGGTITWGAESVFCAQDCHPNQIAALDEEFFVLACFDNTSPDRGGVAMVTTPVPFPVGIAAESGSAGQVCPVVVAGVVDGVYTNLESGCRYYADGVGGITTADTGKYIGRAISADKLLIRTDWEW